MSTREAEMAIHIYNLTVRLNDLEERLEALEAFERDYIGSQQIEYESGHMQ